MILDENQQAAVSSPIEADTLCISVAGSGKTTILTHRVSYLLERGYKDSQILLLTFTNKSAREMLSRVGTVLKRSTAVVGGTFHSFCHKVATEFLPYEYTILDTSDSHTIVGAIIKEHFDKQIIDYTPQTAYSRYSFYRNGGQCNFSAQELIIHQKYEEAKRSMNALDYDDLLIKFIALLEDEDILRTIRSRYYQILIDEAQDMNRLQYKMLKRLVGPSQRMFIVGDPNQSIYSFRGASPSYMYDLIEDESRPLYKYIVDTNYRSSNEILRVANKLYNGGYPQPEEPVNMVGVFDGPEPKYVRYENQYRQAEFIAKEIKSKIDSGIAPSEIAIIIRSAYPSLPSLEAALMAQKIRPIVRAGYSYFERAHIKDILSFMTMMVNPNNFIASMRTFCLFDGIAHKTGTSLSRAWANGKTDEERLELCRAVKMTKRASSGFEQFAKIYNSCCSKFPSDIIQIFFRDFYFPFVVSAIQFAEKVQEQVEDIKLLVADTAPKYTTAKAMLDDLSLEGDLGNSQTDSDRVTITTIHKAKGLEWSHVYIPFINNGILPSKQSLSLDKTDEEKRLFYVAMTRAKTHLFMSSVRNLLYANRNTDCEESFFISSFNQEATYD